MKLTKDLIELIIEFSNITDAVNLKRALPKKSGISLYEISAKYIHPNKLLNLSDATLKEALNSNKHLQNLELKYCQNITDSFLSTIPNHVSSLKYLNLSRLTHNTWHVTNNVLMSICKIKLKELCIYNCTKITNAGLQYLAEIKSLEKIDLSRPHETVPYQITAANIAQLLANNPNIKHARIPYKPYRLEQPADFEKFIKDNI